MFPVWTLYLVIYLSICAKSPTINNSIYQWIARLLSPRYSSQWILELINTSLRTGILDAAHAHIYIYIHGLAIVYLAKRLDQIGWNFFRGFQWVPLETT